MGPMNINIERADVAVATNQLLDTILCSLTPSQEIEFLEWLIQGLIDSQDKVK